MKRVVLLLIALLAASVAFGGGQGEGAQAGAGFPSRNIELIVPFGAGGGTDRIARAVATSLEKQLQTSVVVVNKTGAGGVLGSNEIATASPDGYTVGVFSNTDVANFVYAVKEGVDFSLESFTYLGGLNETGDLLIVPAGSDIESLDEFVAVASANPGKITVALPSKTQNLAVSLMEEAMDIDVTGVVFGGGGKTLANLIGGHTDAGILSAQFAGQAEEQNMKVLGLMLADRLETISNIPTFAEQGYEISNTACRMLVAPIGLPEYAVAAYRDALTAAYANGLSDQLRSMGEAPVYRDMDQLASFLKVDFAMRERVLSKE